MPVYKDETTNTWYCRFYSVSWDGKKKQTTKRGFKTKREAQKWETDTKAANAASMNVTLAKFVDVYFEDKKGELKERSVYNKRCMINAYIIPTMGNRKMNEITPADIIQWQNLIREKGYSQTYLRMIQNQLTALFTHATNIYGLASNPCKRVKKMGKSDADELNFWTKDEYDQFIATIDKTDRYYVLFEILFWCGCRIGEVLALTQNDVDFKNNQISITKTYFRMKSQGVEPIMIKQRVGHKDIRITLNTYGHLYPNEQKKLAEMLNEKRMNKL